MNSQIKAQIVADSKSPTGERLTTMLVTFPRFILAELNTHRMLSKNSASSRAIPFKKMVESVQNNPFIPIAWQKEHTGMQGSEYYTEDDLHFSNGQSYQEYGYKNAVEYNNMIWLQARDRAIESATFLNNGKVTKQLANRLLEPFMMHTVLISGTEWENFFELRCPQYYFKYTQGKEEYNNYSIDYTYFKSKKDWIKFKNTLGKDTDCYKNSTTPNNELDWFKLNKGQAEIHMMALAEAMWDSMNESTPKELKAGEWHIPFNHIGSEFDKTAIWDLSVEDTIKISTARCARTSYTVVGDEKEFTYEQQIALHDRMANQVPFHASPFEHCARAMSNKEYFTNLKGKVPYIVQLSNGGSELYNGLEKDCFGWSRNYRGFIQYREILENGKNTGSNS